MKASSDKSVKYHLEKVISKIPLIILYDSLKSVYMFINSQ